MTQRSEGYKTYGVPAGSGTQGKRQERGTWETSKRQNEVHNNTPGGGGTPKKTSTYLPQTEKKTTQKKSGQPNGDRNISASARTRAFSTESLGTASHAGTVAAGQGRGVKDTRTAGVARWRERSPSDTPDLRRKSVPPAVYHRNRNRTDHIQSFSTYLSTTSIQCRFVNNCD